MRGAVLTARRRWPAGADDAATTGRRRSAGAQEYQRRDGRARL